MSAGNSTRAASIRGRATRTSRQVSSKGTIQRSRAYPVRVAKSRQHTARTSDTISARWLNARHIARQYRIARLCAWPFHASSEFDNGVWRAALAELVASGSNQMKTYQAAAAVIAVGVFLYYQTSGPSKRELFELRSQCAAMAEKIMKKLKDEHPEYDYALDAHYNVSANRCYAVMNQYRVNYGKNRAETYMQESLFDGQTGELLAEHHSNSDGGLLSLGGGAVEPRCLETKKWPPSSNVDQGTQDAAYAIRCINKLMDR
jgi:hypothetical protein